MQTTEKTYTDFCEKVCFKCLSMKPLSDFYKHAQMADGHLNKCKHCTKQDTHSHRHGSGRVRVLAYDRARAKQDDRKEYARRVQIEWRSKHPDRRNAQIIVGNALRDGRLVKQQCFMCGDDAEAHHPDYSSPLSVVWLCTQHHKDAHALHYHLTK